MMKAMTRTARVPAEFSARNSRQFLHNQVASWYQHVAAAAHSYFKLYRSGNVEHSVVADEAGLGYIPCVHTKPVLAVFLACTAFFGAG